jgi:hypothetical protein
VNRHHPITAAETRNFLNQLNAKFTVRNKCAFFPILRDQINCAAIVEF